MTDWYNLSWSDVVNLFQSDSNRGLDDSKVLKNREIYGKNLIGEREKKLFVSSVLKEIIKPWMFSLIITSIIYFIVGRFISGIIILIILLINVLILGTEKYKEKKRFILLDKVNSGSCNVIRNGNLLTVKNEEIVVGDIIVLKKGTIIPADMRITNCDSLTVIEETVTGHSNIVEKYSAKLLENDLVLTEMKNILFKSSVVSSGNGEGIAVAVGENTEIGKFTNVIFNIEKNESNFYKKIYNILDKLALVGVFAGLAIFTFRFFKDRDFYESILVLATILTIVFPLGLVIIIYLMNLIIKKSMVRDKIFISNISKIEDISKINILCIEKEEILTEKFMLTKKVYDTKEIQDLDKNFIINDNIMRVMETGLLCNDSKIKDKYSEKNSLIEEALIDFGNKYNINKNTMENKQKRIFKISADKENIIKTTVNKIDRKYRAYVKGNVEVLIDRCTHIMKNGIEKEITKQDIGDIKNADINMSNQGLNVLGFAYRNFNYRPRKNENIESNLVFAGLVGFDNPVKSKVKEDIDKCRCMSIKPVIFTEDSKLTAGAFGKEIGILNAGDIVISDIEIDYMEKSELEKNIERVSIFSRIQADNKFKIISKYRDLNYKLILTGNRIVDLPSFMRAGLCISFGGGCSEVVKKFSDVYLEKIDFSKIIYLIEKSKNLIYIIREIIKYLCIFSLSEFIIYTLSLLFTYHIPFYFRNILWNNIFNGSLISLTVLFSGKHVKIYKNMEGIENNNLVYFRKNLLVDAVLLGLITFLGFYFSISIKSEAYETVTLSILYFSQILLIIKKELLKNFYFYSGLLIYIILNLIILYTKFGGKLFALKAVDMNDVKIILVSIILYTVLLFIKKFLKEKNNDKLGSIDRF